MLMRWGNMAMSVLGDSKNVKWVGPIQSLNLIHHLFGVCLEKSTILSVLSALSILTLLSIEVFFTTWGVFLLSGNPSIFRMK